MCFLQEPIDEWETIVDFDNKNIITKFYENNEKYAFVRVFFRIGQVYQCRLAYIKTYQYLQLMRKIWKTMLPLMKHLEQGGKFIQSIKNNN